MSDAEYVLYWLVFVCAWEVFEIGGWFVHSLVYFFIFFLQLIWEGVGMAMTCGAASWVEAAWEQGGLLQASCVVFLPSL